MVGDRDDDYGRLRRHGAQDLPGHVRRVAVRAHRRPHHSTSGSGHRLQLSSGTGSTIVTETGSRITTTETGSAVVAYSPKPEV